MLSVCKSQECGADIRSIYMEIMFVLGDGTVPDHLSLDINIVRLYYKWVLVSCKFMSILVLFSDGLMLIHSE
jgi:hypothetical protein